MQSADDVNREDDGDVQVVDDDVVVLSDSEEEEEEAPPACRPPPLKRRRVPLGGAPGETAGSAFASADPRVRARPAFRTALRRWRPPTTCLTHPGPHRVRPHRVRPGLPT